MKGMITKMKQIINANIITEDSVIHNGSLLFDKEIVEISEKPIAAPDAEVIDAKGNFVIPGLIDLHIHGYMGSDCSDGTEESLCNISENILKNGVTGFLSTTVTLGYDILEKSFQAARSLASKSLSWNHAQILGVHAEGPFINIQKKGAQNGEYVAKPDHDFVLKNKDIIKLVTIAPEKDPDFEFIKTIKAQSDIVISMGHTDADYELAMEAIGHGASHVTHLFNAMSPLNHRSPGVVGAALLSPKVSCELICDTFHIHPALFKLVSDLKKDKMIAITDCIRAGGFKNGTYRRRLNESDKNHTNKSEVVHYDLGGMNVIVDGIKCTLADGTIAGSVLTLNRAVLNMTKNGVSLNSAVNAASLNPAKVLRIDNKYGSIKVSKTSDFSICDSSFNILSVYRNGKLCFENENL